jgi:hypothetical protein
MWTGPGEGQIEVDYNLYFPVRPEHDVLAARAEYRWSFHGKWTSRSAKKTGDCISESTKRSDDHQDRCL